MPDSDVTNTDAALTADDVRGAVHLAVAALREGTGADWNARAGSLEWDCWETVEHLCNALFMYATQLAPDDPSLSGGIPFGFSQRTPTGPATAISANRDAGPAALVRVLEVSGGLLTSTLRTAPPDVRAWHVYGVADPGGFAAMGVVETLVHVYDVAGALGIGWDPPQDLCRRTLARLFPDVRVDAQPWQALLWATGRTALPAHDRRASWRWYSAAEAEPVTATAAD